MPITESVSVKNQLLQAAEVQKANADQNWKAVEQVAEYIFYALYRGNKVLTCGNGGSACDAIHLAEELVGRYKNNRPPLRAMSLLDPGTITCIANDYGYDEVFRRQIEAHGKEGDVLVAFSTSGKSPNILTALSQAGALGLKTILFTGNGISHTPPTTIKIKVPSTDSAHIQECHTAMLHAIVASVEKRFKEIG